MKLIIALPINSISRLNLFITKLVLKWLMPNAKELYFKTTQGKRFLNIRLQGYKRTK